MKMKRYFAPDMRQAIRKVREDQGPDAVILSNRRVNGGVEIIAALDYDQALVNRALGAAQGEAAIPDGLGEGVETRPDPVAPTYAEAETPDEPRMPEAPAAAEAPTEVPRAATASDSPIERIQQELSALRSLIEAPMFQFGWGELGQLQPLKVHLLRRLTALGLSPELCRRLAEEALQGASGNGWLEALQRLAAMVPVANDDILNEGGVIALVGPTGVGKTTTVAKLAARFALRHGRRHVALVTTDSYRIGAHEQLRTYGRILGIPVQTAADRNELQMVLNHARDRKLVLIDTAGVSQRDLNLMEKLSTLDTGDQRIRNYLVLSATGQRALQREVIAAFRKAGLHHCIITKVDEANSLGGVLSVLIENQLPAAYVGDGQQVPDDLHPARAERLVKLAVELMQQQQQEPDDETLAFNFGGLATNARA